MSPLQRKYVDLIRDATSKWANWDPPIPVKVGAFGTLDRVTGELEVRGNVYDADFQETLDKIDPTLKLKLQQHPPVIGPVEEDFIISTSGAQKRGFSVAPGVDIMGLATASLKADFQFSQGKRDAFLVMHSPRMEYFPPSAVLSQLYNIPALADMYLVTSVFTCPAFSLYLSDKSGEQISLALLASAPIVTPVTPLGPNASFSTGIDWWTNASRGILRKGVSKEGEYVFTPLYVLKKRAGWTRKIFRSRNQSERGRNSEDELWVDVDAPWDPLDEDGEEDPIDVVSLRARLLMFTPRS
ncbi:hypothetical protein EDD16DRAFT_1472514 [Pisolithus croceorrhizus]|nr:hypothetical protein EDD16DRAFT_1472514 [Pisolithus croceorrhizus]KAI6133005.1 hypothetical protein EV401DRAFT_2253429 [Pisolithus croceorrhizus]